MSIQNTLLVIVHKEFVDHIRNGWIVSIAIAFALFACVITYAGFGFSGNIGQMEEQGTLLSLISLVIYLVPLLGLLLGYNAISGEYEQGTLDLLRTYPFDSKLLIYGKWLGLSAILTSTLFLGLSIPAATSILSGHSTSAWLLLLGCSAWIGIIFISINVFLSVHILERGKLIAISFGVWLLLAVLYDIGIMGLLVYMEGDLPDWLMSVFFYLNPTTLFRFLAITLLLNEEMILQLGLSNQLPAAYHCALGLTAWTLLPIFLAGKKIARMNQ